MADPELLRYLAAKSGLGLKYLSKDEKISILLGEIRSRFPDVVLKGGTALNRAYLAKSGVCRFSEDIDLDVISKKPLPEKIASITGRMKTIPGFEIEGPHLIHRTMRFDCQYSNEFGDIDRVMAEFYLTRTRAVKTLDALVVSPFIETHPTIFTIYSLEDLLARKLIALYNRGEGKDMYDVFYALEEKIDRAVFNQALTFTGEHYRIKMESFPKDLIDKLHTLRKNAIYIGNSTNHFIPRQRRPDWRTFIDSLIQNIEGFFS
jgi:predicted nucleotidyltransferase component of viral defense system